MVQRNYERVTVPPSPDRWGSWGRALVVPPVRVERPDLVHIGDDVIVLEHCWMSVVQAFPDQTAALILGDGVRVGRGCQFSVAGRMTIGERVLVGDFVQIGDTSHDYRAQDRGPALTRPRAVTIEPDVVVSGQATVLPGVTVGRGAVVEHHAVVAHDVAPFTRVAGNPARVVGSA